MMNGKNNILSATTKVQVRFSEVDSMGVVWHGNYVKYFEDAREAFGKKYNLEYLTIFGAGLYTPLVEVNMSYKHSVVYGQDIEVEIVYKPCEAAKICFDYNIYGEVGGERCLMMTGSSVQVFLDAERQLLWTSPEFYEKWKERWRVATSETSD
jgi:acyl-CoA thioester hydrolase